MAIKYRSAFILQFIIWLLFTIFIVYASLTPSFAPPATHHIDKIMHFCANFVIAFIPGLYCRSAWSSYCTVLLVILLGVSIELAQDNIEGREGSIGDIAANSLGVITSVVTARQLSKLARRSRYKRSRG